MTADQCFTMDFWIFLSGFFRSLIIDDEPLLALAVVSHNGALLKEAVYTFHFLVYSFEPHAVVSFDFQFSMFRGPQSIIVLM